MVTIILVNWHGWRDTLVCLQSLEGLRYSQYQVVVVDNGSTDDSVERIHEAYPELIVLETGKNLGFAGGNNVGIRRALADGADFVWLLNNDTKVAPDTLTNMIAQVHNDPQIAAVGSVLYDMSYPDHVQAWGGGYVNQWLGVAPHHKRPVDCDRLEYIHGASLLLRRAALEQVGLLDEGFFMCWEDTELGFRLRKAGWKLAVASQARVWHKESASIGRKSPVLDSYFNQSAVRFFQKNSSFPALPILIGVGGRLVKRAVRGDWTRVRAVWRGAVSAMD